jgi:hypothetical protein
VIRVIAPNEVETHAASGVSKQWLMPAPAKLAEEI